MYDRMVDEKNSFVSNPSWIFHTALTTKKSSSDPRVPRLINGLCCCILSHAKDFSIQELRVHKEVLVFALAKSNQVKLLPYQN